MSGNNKNISHYSSSDIQKYLRGELSAPEMNALEKAALEDPFLADAIEGIESAHSPAGEASFQDGMNELKKRLDDRITKKNKRAAIPMRRSAWMAAASLILLAGLGAAIYFLSSQSKTSSPLARQLSKSVPATAPVAATPATSEADSVMISVPDTVRIATGRAIREKSSAEKFDKEILLATDSAAIALSDMKSRAEDTQAKTLKTAKFQHAAEQPKDLAQTSLPAQQASAAAKSGMASDSAQTAFDNLAYKIETPDLASRPAPPGKASVVIAGRHGPYSNNAMSNNSASNNSLGAGNNGVASNGLGVADKDMAKSKYYETDKYLFKGKVIDENNLPVIGANLSLAGQPRLATVSDNQGLFQLNVRNKDSALRLLVNYVGYEPVSMELNTDNITGNIIQLKRANNSLNEVVVVGFGSQKKMRTTGSAPSSSAPASTGAPKIVAKNAIPAGGRAEYKSWLEKNWRAGGADSSRKGSEIVSFTVNKKGELSSFRIQQSLSSAHDSVLVNLIRLGPAWKLAKGKKDRVTVTVSF
jgi:hypothetical protein